MSSTSSDEEKIKGFISNTSYLKDHKYFSFLEMQDLQKKQDHDKIIERFKNVGLSDPLTNFNWNVFKSKAFENFNEDVKSDKKFLLVPAGIISPYYTDVVRNSFMQVSNKNNASIHMDALSPVFETDYGTQKEIVEYAINHDYDGIIISSNNMNKLLPKLKEFKSMGNKRIVEITNADFQNNGIVDANCGFEQENMLLTQIRHQTQKYDIDKKSTFAILTGNKNSDFYKKRISGLDDSKLAEYHLTKEQFVEYEVNFSEFEAFDIMSTVISENPNLGGIYCQNDGGLIGALNYLETVNESIPVIGNDYVSTVHDRIKNNQMASTIDVGILQMSSVAVKSVMSNPSDINTPKSYVTKSRVVNSMTS